MTIGRVRIWVFLLVCLLPLQAMAEAGRVLYSRGTVTVVDAFDSARGAQAGTLLPEKYRCWESVSVTSRLPRFG